MIVLAVIAASALISAGLIVWLRPLLVRYALARPNARSSHSVPTPQGGGIAVVAASIGVAGLFSGVLPGGEMREVTVLALATLLLALTGAVDDIRPLSAALRLALQALAVTALILAIDGRLLPEVPLWLERGLAVIAGLWFVNLVNFMDGLDW